MQELEKILGEIEGEENKVLSRLQVEVSQRSIDEIREYVNGIRYAKDIIRKHMNDMNDGWIPVDERLPTMEEYQKDDGRSILDDGNRRYAGYFDVYTGKFYRYRHLTAYRAELYEDNGVIAWRPLPEPYRPEKEEQNNGRE